LTTNTDTGWAAAKAGQSAAGKSTANVCNAATTAPADRYYQKQAFRKNRRVKKQPGT